MTADERDSSPIERFRPPYTTVPNPGWKEEPRREEPRREEPNPRPTLGEEPPRPPTRSRSVKPAKAPSSVKEAPRRPAAPPSKRGRSAHRRRDESDYSDDDYEDAAAAKYEGYGKRYEGDGLYESLNVVGYGGAAAAAAVAAVKQHETNTWALSRYDQDPSPPTRTTTPHHPAPSSAYHPREQSRGPPTTAGRKTPAPEKDIREYTYQDQYAAAAPAPTVSASGPAGGARKHHGSSTASNSGNRRSGQWRY